MWSGTHQCMFELSVGAAGECTSPYHGVVPTLPLLSAREPGAAWLLACQMLTRSREEWRNPGGVLQFHGSCIPLEDDPRFFSGSELHEAFENARAVPQVADYGGGPENWMIIKNIVFKTEGRFSLANPGRSTARGRSAYWQYLIDDFVLAVRAMHFGAAKMVRRFQHGVEQAPGHFNPWGTDDLSFDGLSSLLAGYVGDPSDLFLSQYLSATSRFHFIDFAIDGPEGWNRELGMIRLNIKELAFENYSPPPTSFDPFVPPSSDPIPTPADLARESNILSVRRDLEVADFEACTRAAMSAGLDNVARIAGILFHEIGHENFQYTYGLQSGISNLYEGRSSFSTFSIGALGQPIFAVDPIPAIVSIPNATNSGVTRHWVCQWLGTFLHGYLLDWEIGAAAQLDRMHLLACGVANCCPASVRLGATGYLVPPGGDVTCFGELVGAGFSCDTPGLCT